MRERIARLGSGDGAEDTDHRELRDLLQKQLALLERGVTRREEAVARRACLLKMLSGLWKAARRLQSQEDAAAADLLRHALSQSRAATGDVAGEGVSSTSVTVDRS